MSTALPDAVVTSYEDRVEEFDLPDVDDRHVLAAAVAAGASLLVTDNLDDFPADRVPEGLRVVPTDGFVLELASDNLDVVVDVVETQAAGLVNPPTTASELLDGFEADDGPSQGLIESTNTKIRVLTRMAYGFKSPEALIALALLSLGGYRPKLPSRQVAA